MIRLAGKGRGNDFWIWLFEDNEFTNDPSQWTDLLEGATTVVVQGCTAYIPPDDTVTPKIKEVPQGPWATFTFNMERLTARKNMRINVGALKDGREYLVRFSIDGGPFTAPISVRWG